MAAAGRSRHSVSAALSASDCTPRGAIVAPVMPRLVAETGPRLPWTTAPTSRHPLPGQPRPLGSAHGEGETTGRPVALHQPPTFAQIRWPWPQTFLCGLPATPLGGSRESAQFNSALAGRIATHPGLPAGLG